MRYLTMTGVKEVTVVLPEAGDCVSVLDALLHRGIPEMFESLFEETVFQPLRYIGDSPDAAPSECRMVSDYWTAYAEARRGNVNHVFLANLNADRAYIVRFQEG